MHTPKTPETTNLINASVLAKMKPGVRIINVARGGIVDETALAAAIEDGKVAGAAFDVYDQEPPNGSPLLKLTDKVVLTPHLGASTQEAQFNVAIDLAEQIGDYLKNGVAKSPVNLPFMRPEFVKELGKYIWLAEAMGTIASELKSGDVLKLEVISVGDLTTKSDAPLVVAALRGMLAKRIDGVTYVNAQLIARNKGIQVVSSKSHETSTFNEELRVIVTSKEGVTSLAGTILAHDEAMITEINSHPVNLYPVPMMLFTEHRDEPGVVAKVASVLAKHDVNISNMSLARNNVRAEAVMVMGMDDILSKDVLSELTKLTALNSVHFVSLSGMSRHS